MFNIRSFVTQNATALQISLFLCVIAGLWIAEKVIQAEPMQKKCSHSATNALFILSALPIELGLSACMMMVSAWVTVHHWGLVYLFPQSESPWIKYVLMFFVLDLLDYTYHVTMHQVKNLWRFHLVHHTDMTVDVSTNVREHPGETFFRNCFLILFVFLSGASFGILFLRQLTQTISNVASHTSFRLPPRAARIVGWLFITPNLHHVHHHRALPHTDRNYGDVFSIWDRLFGTFAELPGHKTVFGLDTHANPAANNRYRELLMMPLALSKK